MLIVSLVGAGPFGRVRGSTNGGPMPPWWLFSVRWPWVTRPLSAGGRLGQAESRRERGGPADDGEQTGTAELKRHGGCGPLSVGTRRGRRGERAMPPKCPAAPGRRAYEREATVRVGERPFVPL